jgi:RNA polymerase sigma factor, sigma-70 family/RNA polymerase sigma-70 factor, sigma-E family
VNRDDEQAFTEWATTHLGALVRFGFALTHDEGGAEDLVQTALTRTLLAWPRLRNQVDPGQYVRRVMVNEQRSAWRSRRRHPEVRFEPLGVADAFPPDEAELVERDRVWRELVNLPPGQRAVLVLRFYEDRPEREVAALLGCSVGTVKSQTSKALAKLRAGELLDREGQR